MRISTLLFLFFFLLGELPAKACLPMEADGNLLQALSLSDHHVELFTWVNEVYSKNSHYTSLNRDARDRQEDKIWWRFTRVASTMRRETPELYAVIFCRMTILELFPNSSVWNTPENYCEAYNDGMMAWQGLLKDSSLDARDYRSDLSEIGFEESMLTELRTHNYAIDNQIDFSRCCAGDADGDGICDAFDDCDFDPGPVDNNGCPEPICIDPDGDGVCVEDDECPELPGDPANNGCPPCYYLGGDSDGDGICDKVDNCPEEEGTVANYGCPEAEADEIVYMDGKIMYDRNGNVVYTDEAKGVMIRKKGMDMMVYALMDEGVSNTEQLHFGTAIGFEHNEKSIGRNVAMRTLNVVDELDSLVLLFPVKEYVINKNQHPAFYGKQLDKTLRGLHEIIRFLVEELEMPLGSWSVELQGGADKPTFSPTPIPDPVMRDLINTLDFYKLSGEEYIRSGWRLGDTYVNPDLPNARAGWFMSHLLLNPTLASYKDNFRALEGSVSNTYDPEKRNVTIFFSIDKSVLQAASRKHKEERMPLRNN